MGTNGFFTKYVMGYDMTTKVGASLKDHKILVIYNLLMFSDLV